MSLNGLGNTVFPLTLDGTTSLDLSSLTIDGANVDLSNLVPYQGANQTLDMGAQNIRTTHVPATNPDVVNKQFLDTTVNNLVISIAGSFLDKVTTTPQTVIGNVSYTAQLSADDLVVPESKEADLGGVVQVSGNHRRTESDAGVTATSSFGSITNSLGVYQATSTANFATLQLATVTVGKRYKLNINVLGDIASYTSSIQLYASTDGTSPTQSLGASAGFIPGSTIFQVITDTFVPAYQYIILLCVNASPTGAGLTVKWFGLELYETGVELERVTLPLLTASKVPILNNRKQLVSSGTDASKLDFLDNVGSDIQTQLNSKLDLSGSNANQNIVIGSYKVQSTATPSVNSDYTTKLYVDSEISGAGSLYLLKTGGTMTGDIVMGANKVTSTATPTTDDTLTRKGYVDAQDATKLNLSGGTMNGNIVMAANTITTTTNPTTDDQLTRKGYVDTQDNARVLKVGDTMTGELILNKTGRGWRQETIGGVRLESFVDATAGWLGTFTNHPLYFYTNNSNQLMALTTGGELVIEGLTANRVLTTNGSKGLASSTVTTTTLGFLDATSSVQNQLNAKANLTGGNTFSGNQVFNSGTISISSRLFGEVDASPSGNFLMGLRGTGTESDRLAIAIVGNSTTGSVSTVVIPKALTLPTITSNRVLTVDGDNIVRASSVSTTTLAFLDATSSVQTQIDGKVAKAGDTMSGALQIQTTGFAPLTLTRTSAGTDFGVGSQHSLVSTGNFQAYYARALGGSDGAVATTAQTQANGYYAIDVANAGVFGSDTAPGSSLVYINKDGTRFNGTVGIGIPSSGAYVAPISRFTINSNYSGGEAGGFAINATDDTNSPNRYNLRLYPYVQAGSQVAYQFRVNNIGTGVNAMSIGYNGNIGIGTTSPGVKLQVVGNTSLEGQCNISGNNVLEFGSGLTKEVNSGKVGYGWVTTGSLDIVGGGTTAGTRQVICYDRLGVGIAPTESFQTSGNARFGGNIGVGTEPSGTRFLRVTRAITADSDWSEMISFENSAVGTAYTHWEAGANVFSGKSRFTIRGGTKNFNTLFNYFNLDSDGRASFFGLLGVSAGNPYAIPNNFMNYGSLTIGDIDVNYGGGNNWNANTAGLLMECKDNTEIAVHDAGNRVASLMYFQGGSVNTITIGRDMFWGLTPLIVASRLQCNGSVGIGTTNPVTALHIARAFLADGDYSGMISFENTQAGGYLEWQMGPQVIGGGALFSIRGGADGFGGLSNLLTIKPISGTVSYVGIGTTNPSAPLTVNGSITIKSVNGVYEAGCIYSDVNWGMLMRGAVAPNIAHFRWDSSAGGELMRLDTNGNLGINITPRAKLDVEGDIITGWGNYRIGTQYLSNTSGYFLGLQTDANNRVLNLVSQAGDSTGSVRISTGVAPTERMRITSGGSVGIGTNAPIGAVDIYNTTTDYTNSVVIRTPWSSVVLDNTQVAGGRKWSLLSGGTGAGVGVGGFGLYDITASAYRIGVSTSGDTSIYGETLLPGTPIVGSTRTPTYRLSLDNFSTTGRAIWAPLQHLPLYTTPFPSYINWASLSQSNIMNLPVTCHIHVQGFVTFYTDTVGQRFAYARLRHQPTGNLYYPEFTKFFNITSNHEVVPIDEFFYGMPAGAYDLLFIQGGNVFVDGNDRAMISITIFT